MSTVYYPRRTDLYDVFAEYVLDTTTPDALKNELRKWLKPNLQETGPEHEIYQDRPNSEFRAPNELTSSSLCEKANAFYEDERFQETRLVKRVSHRIPIFYMRALFYHLRQSIWCQVSVCARAA